MLVARRIRKACPACKARLLSTLFRHKLTYPLPLSIQSDDSLRRFAAARAPHESVQGEGRLESPSNCASDSADAEAFVRNTKEIFRDTLPKDYLTKDELRLYERLYGPPL